ncbi:hypothetical protein niasHT_006201 [Heterodera trifolii]|uniref:PAZ domain-containing protein n=1 Tax=Heterodera trifolii TaxID=157864 RepID=A0ABD2M2F0_9BILA
MDAILATDWLHNAFPERKTTTTTINGVEEELDNAAKSEEQISWLKIIEEEEERGSEMQTGEMEVERTKEIAPPKRQHFLSKCSCNEKQKSVPLIDFLCQHYKCSIKELHVLLQTLNKRREVSEMLRSQLQLRTNHLRPAWKNFRVHCNELTIHPAQTAYALRGYLGITVRIYYYVKHGIKLVYPQLPCVLQFGGGDHCSLFPLECLSVIKDA